MKRSPLIGMRMHLTRSSTPRLRSLKDGSMMNPPVFLTLTLRNRRNGTTKKMVTGSHPLSVTPNATKLLAVVPGRRKS
jgi:hypothetical protein